MAFGEDWPIPAGTVGGSTTSSSCVDQFRRSNWRAHGFDALYHRGVSASSISSFARLAAVGRWV